MEYTKLVNYKGHEVTKCSDCGETLTLVHYKFLVNGQWDTLFFRLESVEVDFTLEELKDGHALILHFESAEEGCEQHYSLVRVSAISMFEALQRAAADLNAKCSNCSKCSGD